MSESDQQDAIKSVTAWCEDFLRWLKDIHYCDNERVQLFKAREYFGNPKSLKGEKFSDLLWDDSRSKELLQDDNAITLKNKIGELDTRDFGEPNQGVAGLAKAVYVCCKV